MPLGQKLTDCWQAILNMLKFLARLPPAFFVLFGGAALCFMLAGIIYRATEWFFQHVLAHPW
jgi:hypothetical protein